MEITSILQYEMSKQTIVLSKLSGELHQDLHLLKKKKKK